MLRGGMFLFSVSSLTFIERSLFEFVLSMSCGSIIHSVIRSQPVIKRIIKLFGHSMSREDFIYPVIRSQPQLLWVVHSTAGTDSFIPSCIFCPWSNESVQDSFVQWQVLALFLLFIYYMSCLRIRLVNGTWRNVSCLRVFSCIQRTDPFWIISFNVMRWHNSSRHPFSASDWRDHLLIRSLNFRGDIHLAIHLLPLIEQFRLGFIHTMAGNGSFFLICIIPWNGLF